MEITRRELGFGLAGTVAAGTVLRGRRARAAQQTIRIGVLNDMSGPYRDPGGPDAVIAAQLAADDFGASKKGIKVEVIGGDHRNQPDIGSSIARRWLDQEGVDVIADVPTSSVALAVATIVKEKKKAYLNSGAGTPDLTGKFCNPYTIHWGYDTYMLGIGTGSAVTKTGGKSWYFITANYVFGQQLQRDTAASAEKAGGKVLGASPYPFPETTDFSSYLLAAQASGAKVIGLANAGDDTVNCVKQANEFGLRKQGLTLACLLLNVQAAHAIGLPIGQGLVFTESFYWNLNDRTRAFSKRFVARTGGNHPSVEHAGCYGAVLHYLKAAEAIGVEKAKADAAAAVAKMKQMPTDDDAWGKQHIRADGRFMTPAYLFRLKKPADSKGPWDLYDQIAETPADEVAMPLSEEHCPLAPA